MGPRKQLFDDAVESLGRLHSATGEPVMKAMREADKEGVWTKDLTTKQVNYYLRRSRLTTT